MFTKHIIVEVTGDMAIVMQVIMFNGSPVKRLLLNAEGSFIEEPKIDMQNDGALYVHSAHVDAAQQSVQPTCGGRRFFTAKVLPPHAPNANR